jgi:hypothetical protein
MAINVHNYSYIIIIEYMLYVSIINRIMLRSFIMNLIWYIIIVLMNQIIIILIYQLILIHH